MQTALLVVSAILLIVLLKKERQRNLTEESFISIVNHTFRTPLTRMKWMSETLEQEIPRKEQIEISKSLASSANRLLDIIDTLTGIKDIHNSSSYDLKAISLREILEEAMKKCGSEISNKKLLLEIPSLSQIPLLSVNTKKISFVVQVMLENAIMYSKDGGKIKIDAQVGEGNLILSIEDEGIGMTWREKHNVFKKFYRGERAKKVNTNGMGLGLYMSKEIVKRHGGQIKAVSKGRNRGSMFYIELPIKVS